MSVAKIAITIDKTTLSHLDRLVAGNKFPNRSRAIQEALEEKLQKAEGHRLEEECAKLDSDEERALAEEGFGFEAESWPEY